MAQYFLGYAEEIGSGCFYLYEDAVDKVHANNPKFSGVLSLFLEKYIFKGNESISVEVEPSVPLDHKNLLEIVIRAHNRIVAHRQSRDLSSALVESALGQ